MKVKKKKGKGIIPKLKKSLGSYAKSETGKISKQSLLTIGSIVGGAAIGAAISTKTAGAGLRFFAGTKTSGQGGVSRGGTSAAFSSNMGGDSPVKAIYGWNTTTQELELITKDKMDQYNMVAIVKANGEVVLNHPHHSSY